MGHDATSDHHRRCRRRSRSRCCCGGAVVPAMSIFTPSGFSLPPLILLLLLFDTAPPPPAAIIPPSPPSPSTTSSSQFFLFLATYIAKKEYPSIDPPLHPWHNEHRFFDGSFGRPHLWHSHVAPTSSATPKPTTTAAHCAAAGDLLSPLPPLSPSVPQDRAPLVPLSPGGNLDDGIDNDYPAFFAALATPSMTKTPPSSRPSRLPQRRHLYRTPPKGTPRCRRRCPTPTWTGAPRTTTADIGPSRPPSPPYCSASPF